MTDDRRAALRCPVCQGPAKDDSEGRLRCRNSLCRHNHEKLVCPRCQSEDVDPSGYDQGKTKYSCKDCQNHWSR